MSKSSIIRTMFGMLCAAAISAGVAVVPAGLAAQQPYHVIAKWKIGGASSWDYVHIDSATQRLYVSHGQSVEILDAKTGKLLGTVDGLKGCHGIALDAAGKFGYISDGSGIVIFNAATFAKVKTIPTQYNPDGIIFEPVTKTVWSYDGRAGGANAMAVDTATQEVVATIDTTPDGRLEAETIDGKGHLFGNFGGVLARVDAKTKQIDARWTTGCTGGSGLAYDEVNDRIFQICRGNKMFAVDAKTGAVLGSSEIGNGPDGAGYSAKYHLAFASTSDGFVTVVDAKAPGYPVLGKIETQFGARTMDYDPTTDRIYTITAERDPNVQMPSGPPGPPPQGQAQGQPGGPGGPGGPGAPGGQAVPGGPGGPGGPPSTPRPSPYKPDTFSVIVIGR